MSIIDLFQILSLAAGGLIWMILGGILALLLGLFATLWMLKRWKQAAYPADARWAPLARGLFFLYTLLLVLPGMFVAGGTYAGFLSVSHQIRTQALVGRYLERYVPAMLEEGLEKLDASDPQRQDLEQLLAQTWTVTELETQLQQFDDEMLRRFRDELSEQMIEKSKLPGKKLIARVYRWFIGAKLEDLKKKGESALVLLEERYPDQAVSLGGMAFVAGEEFLQKPALKELRKLRKASVSLVGIQVTLTWAPAYLVLFLLGKFLGKGGRPPEKIDVLDVEPL